jgi:hypothetical protein
MKKALLQSLFLITEKLNGHLHKKNGGRRGKALSPFLFSDVEI